MQASHTITPVFDDPNLVACAGLVPALRLAESAGLHDLLGEHLSVDSPNPVLKSAGVVAVMLAGADSIDDMDVLRHGAMPKLFGGSGLRRRSARSCARSPTATSSSWTRWAPGCWPGSRPGCRA